MQIEKVVKEIQEINGYRSLAILKSSGEILYLDKDEKEIDLAFISSKFFDTFYKLNETTLDSGVSNLVRLEAETEDGVIFLLYKSKTHSIFTIFNPKGNISLARIILSKSLKRM